MNRRVSIVVPVYNSHATLPQCLESLIAQTYDDLEIICVNDKSKDNSLDIIKEYQKKDSRIILVDHEKNKNAGGARNSGIKAATGTYVCFVDNDDWLTPDAIEVLVGDSENCRIDLVVPQWCEYYSEERKTNQKNLIVGASKKENCEYSLLNGCRILGCLIRKDIFISNNLFYPENTFFEDNAIGTCLLYSANDIKVVDKVLYYYQMIDGSSSRSISLVKIIDRIKTSGLAITNMERLGYVNDENKKMLDCQYLCFSYHTIRMLAGIGSAEAKEHLAVIASKIAPMMPNNYLKQFHKNFVLTLAYPYFSYSLWKIMYSIKRLLPNVIVEKFKRI